MANKLELRAGFGSGTIFEPVFCSEGTIENSPAFQCRDSLEKRRVPQGRSK
jgi:hypothetical protein